jgi:predicted DNA-binding transcriptional regulator YafY
MARPRKISRTSASILRVLSKLGVGNDYLAKVFKVSTRTIYRHLK